MSLFKSFSNWISRILLGSFTKPSSVVEALVAYLDEEPELFEILPCAKDLSIVIIRIRGNVNSIQVLLTTSDIWITRGKEKYLPNSMEKYLLVSAVQRWIEKAN